jgi:ABC-type uncharacterized transport system substrate-binding protein
MLVKELLALSPDVVVAQSTALTAAFRRESRNVPIVFIAVGDPIGAGFIVNLARPGSNAALRRLAVAVNARKPQDEQPPQHLAEKALS